MGRYIYADQVGCIEDDSYVHKFWVATQPSDVSDYLKARKYGPDMFVAYLSVDHEDSIKARVSELREKFEKKHGMSYVDYMQDAIAEHTISRSAAKFASRINLGEHLLQTIANMKAAGISQQQLTIER